MEIHVARGGNKYGPYTLEDVNAHLETGSLKADDLGWCEGMEAWSPLHTIKGVTASSGTRRPPPPPPSAPSQPAAARPIEVKPDNHLVAAIWVTLLCCLPFGIAAIFHAWQVDSKWNAGDHPGAHDSAGKAQTCVGIAIITGVVFMVPFVLWRWNR